MKRYIVMEIGCLECGEPTHLHGPYKTLPEARECGLFNPKPVWEMREGGSFRGGDWYGSGVNVIYEIEI